MEPPPVARVGGEGKAEHSGNDIDRPVGSLRIGPAVVAAAVLGACGQEPQPAQAIAVRGGNADAGAVIIRQVGCVACHQVPGVDGPPGNVGPSLEGFGGRGLIAGKIPNRPAELTGFVRNAPAFDPQTAMPPMPLTEDQARHVAAYLYTLR